MIKQSASPAPLWPPVSTGPGLYASSAGRDRLPAPEPRAAPGCQGEEGCGEQSGGGAVMWGVPP